jgi:hypothetical protein
LATSLRARRIAVVHPEVVGVFCAADLEIQCRQVCKAKK